MMSAKLSSFNELTLELLFDRGSFLLLETASIHEPGGDKLFFFRFGRTYFLLDGGPRSFDEDRFGPINPRVGELLLVKLGYLYLAD